MFERLIESAPGRRRGGMQAAVSVAVHGMLVIAAVRASTIVAEPRAERGVAPDTIPWILSEPEPGRAVPRGEAGNGNARADASAPLQSAPRFESPGLPPLDERVAPSGGIGAANRGIGPALGALTGTSPLSRDSTGDGFAGRVFSSLELDRVVEPLEQPAPVYPPALRQAGVTGSVELDYIVGTDGAVEPGSVVIRTAAHPAFAESARVAVLGARFRPAMFRGEPVRQLVRQRVRFDLGATGSTSW